MTPDAPRGPDVQHVYPLYGPSHELQGSACWCGPRVQRLCQQCEGAGSGCWACEGGWVDVESLAPGDRGVVIHNAPGEEPQ